MVGDSFRFIDSCSLNVFWRGDISKWLACGIGCLLRGLFLDLSKSRDEFLSFWCFAVPSITFFYFLLVCVLLFVILTNFL